uniref:Uncharacterized protein n=1 Tax=Oryza rufipogon TaxID=4529 RepID=A0A0E0QBI3_ORYRU
MGRRPDRRLGWGYNVQRTYFHKGYASTGESGCRFGIESCLGDWISLCQPPSFSPQDTLILAAQRLLDMPILELLWTSPVPFLGSRRNIGAFVGVGSVCNTEGSVTVEN